MVEYGLLVLVTLAVALLTVKLLGSLFRWKRTYEKKIPLLPTKVTVKKPWGW